MYNPVRRNSPAYSAELEQGICLCMKSRFAVYIGRFQPFHNGHLSVVKDIIHNYPYSLYVAVPTVGGPLTRANPFTAAERVEMIRACMRCLHLPVSVAQFQVLTEANMRPLPVRLAEAIPEFELVLSGEEHTLLPFVRHGYRVVRLSPPEHRVPGSVIRSLMLEGGNWEQFVPGPVAEYIKKRGLDRRLLRLPDGEKHPWKGLMSSRANLGKPSAE